MSDTNWIKNDPTATFDEGVTFRNMLVLRQTPEAQSRLILAPGIAIETERRIPNRIVRWLHKHLFNFTWEKIEE